MKNFYAALFSFTILLFSHATVWAQMSGTFTVNPAGGADFTSVQAAAQALNSQGMSGNVTLQLANALYQEQVLFEIPDQSPSHMLTIESASGNEQDVIFGFEEAHEDTNYQIAFRGVQALTIRNLSINTSEAENGLGILFLEECRNIHIDNLNHRGNRNDPAIVGSMLVDFFNPVEAIHGMTVENSFFHECSPAIEISSPFFGPQSGNSTDFTLTNNTFFDADGVNLNYIDGVVFQDNLAYGDEYLVQPVKLAACTEVSVTQNVIYNSFSTIQISTCVGSSADPILVANNFISGNSNVIELMQNEYLLFAHNAVFGDDDGAVMTTFDNDNSRIVNNILYQNHTEGIIFNVYMLESMDEPAVFDYNCLYSNGNYGMDLGDTGPVYLDYEEYKSQTGRESNGISVQPNFLVPGEDLHVENQALNQGLPLDEVNTDIDGELRDPNSPTIGADEMDGTLVNVDLTIDTVLTSGDLNGGEQLNIEWFGANSGHTDFQPPWVDRIFLSDDAVLDPSDEVLYDYQVQNVLSAFENYQRQKLLTLDLALEGTKYIIVKVDADADLIEDNANNVAVSAPFTVTPPDLPNLVVTDIQMPENVFSGTQLQVDFTVTNMGNAPAVGEWKELVWYEDQIEGFEQGLYKLLNDPVAYVNNTVGLMPGDSYQATAIFETPYIAQGYGYVRVETDGFDNVVEEIDGNDNFHDALIDSVFINQSPLADLVVEDIQLPAESFAGEQITISYTVKNVGTETTSPVELPFNFYYGWVWGALFGDWVDYIYFSDTTLSFAPEDYERVFTRQGNLEVDSTYLVTETITLPECTSGDFLVTVHADRWNHVAELVENNNALVSDTIHIIPRPAPDLVPSSNDPATGLASNSSGTLSYRVDNLGADTAFGAWRDRIFISYSDTFLFDIEEMTADTMRFSTLAPDAGEDFEIHFDIPPHIYGDAYIYLWIDATNDECEYPHDDNNILRFPVTIEQSPAADLEAFFTPPAGPVTAGDALGLVAVVSNEGEDMTNHPNWTDRIYLMEELSSDTAYAENYSHTGGLDVDEAYNLPDPFVIPLDVEPGFYHLGVFTDAYDQVWENESETNNNKIGEVIQIIHDSTRAPDLKPMILAPQAWSTGQDFAVDITFTNTGAGIGLATWVDELVLTDTTGVELASATQAYSGELTTDGAYISTFEIQIPTGAPAQARFVARVDTSGEVFEYQTANNTREFAIDINVGPAPDLSPTDLQVPQEIHAGQELMISAMRNNFGDAPVQNGHWVERILLSNDDQPDEDDYILRSYVYVDEGMGAAFSESFTDSVAIPLNRVGEYYVIYVMDADDQIAEGGFEANNHVVSDQPLIITLPAPVDFASEMIEIDIVDGNPEWIKYSIENTSVNGFEGKFYNTWYLSTDAEYSADDKLLGLDIVADYNAFGSWVNLPPGESRSEYANFLYVPVVAGDYYIIQKIDAFLNVYETDEDNNTVVFGPFAVDNVQEIFPDITYEKQFGRNLFLSTFFDGFFGYAVSSGLRANNYGFTGFEHTPSEQKITPSYDSGFDPTPDRHDYKIDIPDEFGMVVRMWEDEVENEQYGINNESQPIYEMYVGEGFVPTPLHFDFRFDSPMQSDQTIIVPVAGDRTDYIKTQAPYIPPHFDPEMRPVSNYFLRAEFKEFSVYSMHPEKVGISHNVTLRIKGFDLADTAGLDVALINGADTVYAFETYSQNPSELVGYIDMRGHEPGAYQLMVRKRTTGDYTVWEQPVEVFEDDAAVLFADVHAPTTSRSSQDFQVGVTYGNEGYSNIYDMLVIVAVFMDDSTSTGLSVDYLGATYPGYAGTGFISTEANQAEPILLGVLDDAVYYGAYVPIVHARTRETFNFEINGDVPGTITVQASLGLVQRSPYTFTGRVEDAGTSRYITMLANAIGSSSEVLIDFAKAGDCGQLLNADAMTERLANQTYAVAEKARGASGFKDDVKNNVKTALDHDAGIKERYDAFKGLIDQKSELDLTANEDTPFYTELNDIFKCMDPGTVDIEPTDEKCYQTATWNQDGVEFKVRMNMRRANSTACPPLGDPNSSPPRYRPKSNRKINNINSKDPNEIVGPRGIGPARLVDGDESFEYTVYFENTPEATAPAARVRIDNPIDSNLRLASFRIKSFGFGDTSFQFNASPFIQETIDLGAAFQHRMLNLIGGTNPETGKAFFEFTTIDPATQGIVTGAFDGFLWPNDSTGRGQGYVTYAIEPMKDLDPGTEIKNKAAIVFDGNEIIETNTWTNTISGGDLASRVLELPEYSPEEFAVKWIDETPAFGPPVEAFDVYVRDVAEDEGWRIWLEGAKSFNKRFTGTPGHTYEFHSRARSGDRFETVDGMPQARTTILDFGGSLDGNDPAVFPNPAFGSTTLAYLAPEAGAAMRVDLTDARGKNISSLKFTAAGKGVRFFNIPLRSLSAGVYVITLYHDTKRLGSTRLVVAGQRKE